MARFSRFVTGRKTKWIVLVLWILLVGIMTPLGSQLADETTDSTAQFLPDATQSPQVFNLLPEDFGGGETQPGLIIYGRPGGLPAQDGARTQADAGKIAAARELPLVGPPVVPVG